MHQNIGQQPSNSFKKDDILNWINTKGLALSKQKLQLYILKGLITTLKLLLNVLIFHYK